MSAAPQTLDDALDALDGAGEVSVEEPGGRTTVDVVEAGKLGVRVRAIGVGHEPVDIAREADRLTEDLRALPERVQPMEVDPDLGGAILRTAPDEMRRGRFFEVDVRPKETEIRRYRVQDGQRSREDFTLTREQLRDLVDEVRGDPK